jgi:hypothetical protein
MGLSFGHFFGKSREPGLGGFNSSETAQSDPQKELNHQPAVIDIALAKKRIHSGLGRLNLETPQTTTESLEQEAETEKSKIPFFRFIKQTVNKVGGLFAKNPEVVAPENAAQAEQVVESPEMVKQVHKNSYFNNLKKLDWKNIAKAQGYNAAIGASLGVIKVGLDVSGGAVVGALFGAAGGGLKAATKEYLAQKDQKAELTTLAKQEAYRALTDLNEKVEEGASVNKLLKIINNRNFQEGQILFTENKGLVDLEKTCNNLLNQLHTENFEEVLEVAKLAGLINSEQNITDVKQLKLELNNALVGLGAEINIQLEKINNLIEIEKLLKESKVEFKKVVKAAAVGAAVGGVTAGTVGLVMEHFNLNGLLTGFIKEKFFGETGPVFNVPVESVIHNAVGSEFSASNVMAADFLGSTNAAGNRLGFTGLARDAIDRFTQAQTLSSGKISEAVSPNQRIFMEDYLSKKLAKGSKKLTGQMISEAYDKAKNLPGSRIDNLSKYTDKLPAKVIKKFATIPAREQIKKNLIGYLYNKMAA